MVPVYMPHDDGRKSRCRLVTMMTYRSSHIPMLTTIEITNSTTGEVRTFLHHSNCGMRPLHVTISDQRTTSTGPVARFQITKRSYSLPLYQATNASIM